MDRQDEDLSAMAGLVTAVLLLGLVELLATYLLWRTL